MTGALLRSGDDELVDDDQRSSLDLPLSSGLDLLEKDGKEDGGSPGGSDLNDGLDGSDGGFTDGSDLVGEGLTDDDVHELLEEERLNGVSNTLLDEDGEKLASSLPGDRVLLVTESLLNSSGET